MMFALQAADGTFKRCPGDSLSSRYDDYGYTAHSIETAIHYDSFWSAKHDMHEDGKFSAAEGAKVVGLQLTPVEVVVKKVKCEKCEGEGTIYIYNPGYMGTDITCPHCGGDKEVDKVFVVEDLEAQELVALLDTNAV